MKKQLASLLSVGLFSLALTPSADAVLLSRFGGDAYYDTDLDITWLANANLADTNSFGGSGINGNGSFQQWAFAKNWTVAMNSFAGTGYLGFNQWRLPSADVDGNFTIVNCAGGGVTGCSDNELGFLFWEENITPATPGPFSNFANSSRYWSTEGVGFNANNAWQLNTINGSQSMITKTTSNLFAWAVHDGDIGAVPVPAAVWLFGSGLLGLVGVARRKACSITTH